MNEQAVKILLLEENSPKDNLIEKQLEKSKLMQFFETVRSIDDFIKVLHYEMPDIVLVHFTSFDDLTAFFAARKINPNIPFIFIVDNSSGKFYLDILGKGITSCLKKDYLNELPKMIIQMLIQKLEKK